MMPSVGVLDPNYAKALVLDDGTTKICIVTLDGIGSDGTLNELAYDLAVDQGFSVPFDHVMFSSSHSHSGEYQPFVNLEEAMNRRLVHFSFFFLLSREGFAVYLKII
jgi:hypothetical protein